MLRYCGKGSWGTDDPQRLGGCWTGHHVTAFGSSLPLVGKPYLGQYQTGSACPVLLRMEEWEQFLGRFWLEVGLSKAMNIQVFP